MATTSPIASTREELRPAVVKIYKTLEPFASGCRNELKARSSKIILDHPRSMESMVVTKFELVAAV